MVLGGALLWPLRIGLIACCAMMPWFAGPWYAAAVLLALPIFRVLLDAMHEHAVARLCVLGGCLCAALLLPRWLWPVIAVWGVGLLVMSVLHVRPGARTILSGALLAVVTSMLGLALALTQSGGQLIPWLAQALVDLIDRSPSSATLLLNAYQSGLARLEGTMALVPALRLFNTIIIPADVRLQLLYSLRTSIESLLRAYLPRGVVIWVLLTALIPALVAEGCLRSRGRQSDLPPFDQWYLPRELSNGVFVMLLLGLLPYLTDTAVLVYLGTMCYTLGSWACMLQGASLMICRMTERGAKPVTCALLAAVLMALLPLALFFLGCYDQFRDPRHLRGSRDETI